MTLVVLAAAGDRDWGSIPGVRLIGLIIGAVLLYAAIRAMFGRRR